MQLCCSTTSLRKYVLHFLVFISVAIVLLIYNTEIQQTLSNKIPFVINRSCFNGMQREPVILAWTAFFSQNLDQVLRNALTDCPFNCEIRKRDDYHSCQDEDADAIVFHLRNVIVSDLPSQRQPEQHFVSFLLESPIHAGSELLEIPRDYFNTTLGYQLVPGSYAWTYGAFYPTNETTRSSLSNWTTVTDQQIAEAVKKKKDVAYALISNCETNSKRETYITALKGHMNLTLRGDCYEKEENKLSQKCNASCEQNLSQSHFFYLAFENSVCNGYVTEKFFRIAHLIVPVVLRRAILKGIAPDSSFVAADDFSTPKELANFLVFASENTTRYLEFFDWTKHFYRDMPQNNRGVCDLCRDLHYRNVSSPWRNRSSNIQEYYSTEQCDEGVGEKLAQSQAEV